MLSGEEKREQLKDEVNQSEQEARMVLPGIQALFGFQLMAAFNANFKTLLSQGLQNLHLLALICVAVAVMLVLTPAAYHRLAEPGRVSRFLANIAGRFLFFGMIPMMLGIVLDVYVIAVLVTSSAGFAACVSLALFAGFTLLWFVFPLGIRRRARSRAT